MSLTGLLIYTLIFTTCLNTLPHPLKLFDTDASQGLGKSVRVGVCACVHMSNAARWSVGFLVRRGAEHHSVTSIHNNRVVPSGGSAL